MKITTKELRAASDLLLSHLEEVAGGTIDLEEDFYWDIAKKFRYDVYNDPKEYTVGQLSDDWGEVLRVLDGSAEPLSYGLVWFAAVLRAVGEQVVK